MTTILAIDPGTEQSGWCRMVGGTLESSGVASNDDIREMVRRFAYEANELDTLAVESVASYGMPVGAEVFRTVWWTGRFAEAWYASGNGEPVAVYRKDVKLHLCQSPRAKDSNIRQALIDRWGGKAAAIGNAKNPGQLYRVKSHAWAALAVALTVHDEMRRKAA